MKKEKQHNMAVERVDYSIDEEYQQALQYEQDEYQSWQDEKQEEQELQSCFEDIEKMISRYGSDLVEHCMEYIDSYRRKK